MSIEPEAATGTSNAPRAPRLERLQTRQRTTGEKAAAHSRLVRRLRIALPALALLLLAGLLLNTRKDVADDAFLDDFKDLAALPDEYKMANPKFAGVNDEGRPYEITAREALQAPGEKQVVQLVEPRAVTQGQNEDSVVTAHHGVFRSDSNLLDLSDAVTLQHRIGRDAYVLTTPAATVAIREETVQSVAGVSGEGEAGTLQADRMRAYNAEGRVVFEGNVRMRIYPEKARAATKPPDAQEDAEDL
jgi:lipopolysaccharide export system protein LptC